MPCRSFARSTTYGSLESKRYFIPVDTKEAFVEMSEEDLVKANFQKLDSYVKISLTWDRFRYEAYNKFFDEPVSQGSGQLASLACRPCSPSGLH
ncbi:hypothetical protein P154DRAFT_612086 [Amniculicola lignicola CBS 123094]|uniref:Uncharacterized protein n=1 Tax=Amniculicola lignicola CBS 123094 TaxID=1392246 RepID=A0A6A5W287_9PLEO|nr:hypothetical protein P154DRAFT_612086 [Amniculicola lignicola CBS 123094]